MLAFMLASTRLRAAAVGLLLFGLVVATPGAASAARQRTIAPTALVLGLPGSLGPLGPLVDRLVDRLEVADDVAAAKFGTDRPIDDPVRERQLLDQVRADAGELGLNPDS